jgi:L-gulonolactone oxidase
VAAVGRRFTNWGKTHSCDPIDRHGPYSDDEIASLVVGAAKRGETVKVTGAGHSWSDIAMTEGRLLKLDRMQKVLAIDPEAGTVTVQAGIRLCQLNEALAAHGLALPILGSIAEQSAAGVVSTGTHGSSLRWGNLSSLVTGLKMVTGTGEVVQLESGDERLDAARVGLGALGVLTELTLKVVPAFVLEEDLSVISFEQAIETMYSVARIEEFVKWYWLPHTERVAVFRYRAVPGPGRISPLGQWLDEHLLNKWAFTGILAGGAALPISIAPLNRVVGQAYFRPGTKRGRSDHLFCRAMPPVHREAEWSVPAAEGPRAFEALRDVIRATGVRVNFIQEVRFVKGDAGWLSPAHGRDSCQVGAYVGHTREADAFLDAFGAVMKERRARPHWGKEHRVNARYLRSVYPKFEVFRRLRDELDPDRVFDNAFLARVFG